MEHRFIACWGRTGDAEKEVEGVGRKRRRREESRRNNGKRKRRKGGGGGLEDWSIPARQPRLSTTHVTVQGLWVWQDNDGQLQPGPDGG